MKKYFVFLILFFSVIICKSQDNTILVDTTKIWSILYMQLGLGVYSGNTISFIIKDEIEVDNLKYNRIYFCDDSLLLNWKLTDKLIRESSGKVYRKYSGNTGETLIYDFNLEVGDSIDVGRDCGAYYHVKTIDSISINGRFRKRLYLESPGGCYNIDTWIESIGSINNTFNTGGSTGSNEAMATELLCVRDKNTHEIIFQPKKGECYKRYPIRNDIVRIENGNALYPVPVDDVLHFNTIMDSYQLTITDLQSKILLQGNYSNTTSLDCSFLKPGIYIVCIKNGKEEIIKRIVKL